MHSAAMLGLLAWSVSETWGYGGDIPFAGCEGEYFFFISTAHPDCGPPVYCHTSHQYNFKLL